MNTYYIPRNVKGEGRILFVFSTKALIYTSIGAAIGAIFYLIFKILGLSMIGIAITAIFAVLGFCIETLKVPDNSNIPFFKKTGGENIDDIIIRWIKFKKSGKKIYVYSAEEETKDGQ